MREPRARPTKPHSPKGGSNHNQPRSPRVFEAPQMDTQIASLSDAESANLEADIKPLRRAHWLRRIGLSAAGVLLSLSLWLAADALVRDLFARQPWLGWLGLGAAVLVGLGLVAFALREVASIWRLASMDRLRAEAALVHKQNLPHGADALRWRLDALYARRPDTARARAALEKDWPNTIDGVEQLALMEQELMRPLDEKARNLISNAARRVAIVTAISPRALVDIAYVAFESLKLARAIATLYGARPGFFGSWRLAGTILGHLAITGGVALGDSLVQQMLGQGLAARLSARLGEGVVNGLMTVRVGIAAMRVTRPLPFAVQRQPQVMDFMTDLAKIARPSPPDKEDLTR